MSQKIEFVPNTSNTFVKSVHEIDYGMHFVVDTFDDKAIVRNVEYFDFNPLADNLYDDLYEHSILNYTGKETPFSVLSSVTHPDNTGKFVVEVNADTQNEMVQKLVEFYVAKGYKVNS